jgi:hypothetical protein
MYFFIQISAIVADIFEQPTLEASGSGAPPPTDDIGRHDPKEPR